MGSNFEIELANMMDQGDEQLLLGEGPENQQTNVKWVIIATICEIHFIFPMLALIRVCLTQSKTMNILHTSEQIHFNRIQTLTYDQNTHYIFNVVTVIQTCFVHCRHVPIHRKSTQKRTASHSSKSTSRIISEERFLVCRVLKVDRYL